ncbi:hypothetical protein ES707_03629 [subsurface metagenome]
MPIPRFRDADGDYEVILFCPTCRWAIAKDRVTQKWRHCRACGAKLETRRSDYAKNPYAYRGARD